MTWMTPFDCLTSAIVTFATLPWPSIDDEIVAVHLGREGAATDGLDGVHAAVIA